MPATTSGGNTYTGIHVSGQASVHLGNQYLINSEPERKLIADWFAPATFAAQHNDLIPRCQVGTGQWFLNSNQYQSWISHQIPTLFCPGIPGAGKTMIAAIIIDDLHGRVNTNQDLAIIYHYCDYNRRQEQGLADLLASSVRQLFQQREEVPVPVRELYQRHKDRQTRPSNQELQQLISDLIGLYFHVFVVIDALDECRNNDCTRDRFLTILFEQQAQSSGKLQILSTSRSIPQINDRFSGVNQLEIRASEEDVSRYLDGHMDRITCVVSKELQKEIKGAICKAVDGMFLLARLHFNSLTYKTKPRDVRRALESLPKGSEALFVAYSKARDRIESQPEEHRILARRVLSFITCAKRAMTVRELQHALAIEPGMGKINSDEDLDDEATLVQACAGLVIVDSKSRIIHLVHYTTQEYLERVRSNWFPHGRFDLAQSCLAYLMMDEFQSGRAESDESLKLRLESCPFVGHAARYWGNYVAEITEPEIEQSVFSFLGCPSTLECATELMFAGHYSWGGMYSFGPRNVTAMHIAAYFGLIGVAKYMLSRGEQVDAKDSAGATPILWAARYGQVEVLDFLLAHEKIEVGSSDNIGRTTLSWAAENGHLAVVKLLVERGVAADLGDKSGRTPLSRASRNGHEAVVKLLVEQGAAADSEDKSGRTPLSWASRNGHEAVVKVLIEEGAAADSRDTSGRTPLSWAAWNGNEAVVKLLVERGADVDSRDTKYGQTPLSWSAENGHEAVVKLLVEGGAAVDSRDTKYGRTPLSWSAENGYEAVVKLLVEGGAAVDSRDTKYGRTPLSWSAENGHEAVVKLLVDGGAAVNSVDTYKRTPLSWAARDGHEAVVKLLVEGGATVDWVDRNAGTPLSWAARKGHEAVAKVLIEEGAAVDLVDTEYGRTPLSWSAENGHEAVVKLLVEGGADVDSRDTEYGRTPLSWSAEKGHEAVVKLLVERGADVDSRDKDGLTPLSWAAEKGHISVANLLVDGGAAMDSVDKDGRTPLSWSALKGHEAVVKLLVEGGAAVDSRETGYGRTPLSRSAEKGHEAVVKLLVEGGAAVDSRDTIYGRTPLSWAAEKGRLSVVKLLVDGGAAVDSVDKNGRTPLSWAAEKGRISVANLLVDGGAAMDSVDKDGRTPLSWAAEKGRISVAKLPFDGGAAVDSVDTGYGRTLLS